jgi:two-component system, LytTR family, sensor kinase
MLQHTLFWAVSYYYLIHSFSITNDIEKIDYIYTAVFHFNIILGVYINLYFLIPRFLGQKRYWQYALLVAVLLAITAQLNIFIFNYAIDYLLPDYFFVANFSFWQLVQFGFVYLGLTSLLKLSKAWFSLHESKSALIRLEKEKAGTELLFLKSQINPHFLFNSLNNIYSLALKKDPLAPQTLLMLSDVMRYMIYESAADMVPLKKEINYIDNYIDLQRLRIRDNSSIAYEVTGTVDNQLVAPLIFIVFIENSFKHGIKAGLHDAWVNIKLDVKDNGVCFFIENSKGVVDNVEKEESKGLGLENVKRRLSLLYPKQHSLTINDTEEKYVVQLELNFLP